MHPISLSHDRWAFRLFAYALKATSPENPSVSATGLPGYVLGLCRVVEFVATYLNTLSGGWNATGPGIWLLAVVPASIHSLLVHR